MPSRTAALIACAVMVSACSFLGPPTPPRVAPRESGRAFAQRACAGCHAIDVTGESPNSRAPAFRDLARQRSDAQLLASVGEISKNGHVEMPPIYVTPDETRAVIAYMRSLTGRTT